MMSDDAKALEAKIAALEARIDLLASHSGPAIYAKRQSEFDRMFEATKVIANIEDPKARVAEMMTCDPLWIKRITQHMTIDRLAETVDAASASERHRISLVLSGDTKLQLTARKLKGPPRVKIFLKDQAGQIATSSIRGARRSDDYFGVRLSGKHTADSIYPLFEIYPKNLFAQMLKIDEMLRFYVECGDVVVSEVSEAESHALLVEELRAIQAVKQEWFQAAANGSDLIAEPGQMVDGVKLSTGEEI